MTETTPEMAASGGKHLHGEPDRKGATDNNASSPNPQTTRKTALLCILVVCMCIASFVYGQHRIMEQTVVGKFSTHHGFGPYFGTCRFANNDPSDDEIYCATFGEGLSK